MPARGKYVAPARVIATSRVFQHGKTQIPKEVRRALQLKDGDILVWRGDDGRIFVERLS